MKISSMIHTANQYKFTEIQFRKDHMPGRTELQSLIDIRTEVITNILATPASVSHDSDGLKDCTSLYRRLALPFCIPSYIFA